MTKKTPRVQGTDEITVLKKDDKTTKRTAVVARTDGTYSVHACNTMSDSHRVTKVGKGDGSDKVADLKDRGYTKG